MIKIQSFTFNGFQENTYVLFDESKKCIIIDPGCYEQNEKGECIKQQDNNATQQKTKAMKSTKKDKR